MARLTSEEDAQAKREFIEAFFDDIEDKVAYLPALRQEGRRDEAMILCCCYIDGLANMMFWPSDHSARNFVRALEHCGAHEVLSHVHPRVLVEELETKSGRLRKLGEQLRSPLTPYFNQLLSSDELVHVVANVNAIKPTVLAAETWRGSLAAVAYRELRIPNTHNLGSPGGIVFDGTTFRGGAVPRLGFELLHASLRALLAEARQRSEVSNSWFGHDFRAAAPANET